MAIELGLGSVSGVKVESKVRFYFAVGLHNFSQFYAFRIVQMRNVNGVRIGVMITVLVIISFCRSIALFQVFYALLIYIAHSAISRYTLSGHVRLIIMCCVLMLCNIIFSV